MRFSILVILLCCHTAVIAQREINKAIFQHAANTPEHMSVSPEKLVSYLTSELSSETEKVEIIAYWIATHITYDVKSYVNKSYEAEPWDQVLSSGTAICGGYATLFQKLCATAGIKSYVVSGYVKGNGFETTDNFTATNHIWNVVSIAGDYYLFDLTFATGYLKVTGEKHEFIRDFNSQYIFTPASQLIKTHLPAQKRWQLLENPLNMKNFLIGYKPDSDSKGIFHYRDSIAVYSLLNSSDQSVKDALDAYEVNPLPMELAWIYQKQAYDISVSDSEKSALELAIQYYRNAIDIYRKEHKPERVIRCERGIAYINQLLNRGAHRNQ